MTSPQVNDYVVINATQEIGQVTALYADPSEYRITSRGVTRNYSPFEVTRLSLEQTWVLDKALQLVSETIDRYHDEDAYGPVYNEEGTIVYSSAAAAVLRALGYPALLLKLHEGERQRESLERHIQDLETRGTGGFDGA